MTYRLSADNALIMRFLANMTGSMTDGPRNLHRLGADGHFCALQFRSSLAGLGFVGDKFAHGGCGIVGVDAD